MKENKIINVQIDGNLSEKMFQVAQFLGMKVNTLITELLDCQIDNVLADIDNELCIEKPVKKPKKSKKTVPKMQRIVGTDQKDKKDNIL